ncbi:hypothetical protein, partial [Sphingobium sp. Ndbn-10]
YRLAIALLLRRTTYVVFLQYVATWQQTVCRVFSTIEQAARFAHVRHEELIEKLQIVATLLERKRIPLSHALAEAPASRIRWPWWLRA